jgi:hypothetical protein
MFASIDKVLDSMQLAGEGKLGVTHHIVKREGCAWSITQKVPTVFLPQMQACGHGHNILHSDRAASPGRP